MAAKVLLFVKTKTVAVKTRDRVDNVIEGVEGGWIKGGRQFAAAIEDFSCEELERLSEQLLNCYMRKFSI
jgi:hypothetical protein